jgi:type IV secretory pathway protease TraF
MARFFGIIACAASAAMADTTAGVTASLSVAGGNYIIDTAVPLIEAAIAVIKIPDISTEKVRVTAYMTFNKCLAISMATAPCATPASRFEPLF